MSRAAAIAAACVLCAAAPSGRQDQRRPQFRSATTLVPVDVRVVDRQGRPITDLTAADFTILEDGVPQTISHFSSHALVAAEPEPGAVLPRREAFDTSVEPQNHRVFLLLLSRGRHVGGAKALPGAIRFVRERVMPQDRVAVMAFNRATTFTTDHEHIATVLERFRDGHGEIEAYFEHREASELEMLFGSREIPARVQSLIDAIFEGPGGEVGRSRRQPLDLLDPGPAALAGTANPVDLPFDQFVEQTLRDGQSLVSLGTGIQYLRHVAGEKHLIFLTKTVLPIGEGLALMASDARVVLHPVQTGGLPAARMTQGRLDQWRDPIDGQLLGLRLPGGSPYLGLLTRDMRRGASMSGGLASAFRWADGALSRVADVTRFTYTLGYYPTNADWNGRQRRVSVVVDRRGATVLHRGGYRASRELRALDRREFMTHARVAAAAQYDRVIPDISVTLSIVPEREGSQDLLCVTLTIDPQRLSWTSSGSIPTVDLAIAVYVGNDREDLVGESRVDVKLTLDDQSRTEGLAHVVRIRLSGDPAHVKAIVYDYEADLVGSAMMRVQR